MKHILYAGDWHGQFDTIKLLIDKYQIDNCYIIQVGDFGIGFDDKTDLNTLNDLNLFFSNRNIETYVIRGNHDDPKYFNGNHIYSNLKLIPDYSIIKINHLNHLFIGGAISIDKEIRIKNNLGYWIYERFVLDTQKLNSMRDIDIVITHNCPMFSQPFNTITTPNIIKERNDISMAHTILIKNNTIKHWIYGHYHFSKSESINGINFHLLGINEFKEIE